MIIDGHLSFLENENNEFKILSNKQSVEEVLMQRAVKTTEQVLYDKGLLDSFLNAEEVLKTFLFVKRRRSDLGEVNEIVQ